MNRFSPTSTPPPILACRDISKSFGQTQVLKGVSFAIHGGEVLALLGVNGAGKSTLMNILSGILSPDSGTIDIDGQRIFFSCPADALDAGIAMVHQELHLVPELTIADNLSLGRMPVRRCGDIDRDAMNTAAVEVLQRLSLNRPPVDKVRDLRVGEQQIVEIGKALSRQSRVLILDEPTAALSETEVQNLLTVIRTLKDQGVAIIYISHRMDEVLAIASHVLILRDGAVVSDTPVAEVTRQHIIRDMVGQDVASFYDSHRPPSLETVLSVHRLGRKKRGEIPLLADIDFSVHRGEVFGIAGLLGSGRTELLEIIAGACSEPWFGEMSLSGRLYQPYAPSEAIECGVGYVTEDRKGSGLVLSQSIAANIALASLPTLSRWGWMREQEEQTLASAFISRLGIRAAGTSQEAKELSGGNQQKIILAKWLATSPHILLLDEPTRGIDVAAKTAIYDLLRELASQGLAILLVSSDWPELMALSDRILVLRDGRPTALLPRASFAQQTLLDYATLGGPVQPQFQNQSRASA